MATCTTAGPEPTRLLARRKCVAHSHMRLWFTQTPCSSRRSQFVYVCGHCDGVRLRLTFKRGRRAVWIKKTHFGRRTYTQTIYRNYKTVHPSHSSAPELCPRARAPTDNSFSKMPYADCDRCRVIFRRRWAECSESSRAHVLVCTSNVFLLL